ncbi:hypothetical protein WMY93_010322 [Mugilogobius chulae]|uniref:Cadherin domain-containing protein n=1 Tax=Mugilogobius chulae TaxID=88201 RepID=A0AAW0PJJ4_9GOBI
MAKGSLVGNIAHDLGLDVKQLKLRKARIHTGESEEYLQFNKERGVLVIKEKIDREALYINDNPPSFDEQERRLEISESAVVGSKFMLEKAVDSDIGQNGLQSYTLKPTDNFILKLHDQSDGGKKVEMILQKPLDREKEEIVSLLLTAVDGGEPQRSGTMLIHITVLDANDNAPVFTQSVYKASIKENAVKGTLITQVSATDADKGSNGEPGLSIFTVKATDADWNQNARVSYILEDSSVNGVPVSSYVSVSADSGVIHAVRSFDYEQIKDFQLCVKAQDGGSPPLSSNVTVKILIQDQNDNAPQVLYPVQTGGSLVAEMVPRSADVGYLVTKVVAVDVDSGQNAWLSYKLQKAADRVLFEVGSQNGEIRTIRQVTDKDSVKQRLAVIVEDNGQPFVQLQSLLTWRWRTAFLKYCLSSLTLRTTRMVIISVKIYRWRQSRILYHSNLPVIPYYPPRYSDTLGTGTLPHVYNYDTCRTTDSRKSDIKYMQPMSQSLVMLMTSELNLRRMDTRDLQTLLCRRTDPLLNPRGDEEGFLIGNVAQDLGLDIKRLRSGRARIVTGENVQYAELKTDKGTLVVNERIDREQLCGDVTPCSFTFEILLENPMELHPVTIEVLDVNDNAPTFQSKQLDFEIGESAMIESRFDLEAAGDADVGEMVCKTIF